MELERGLQSIREAVRRETLPDSVRKGLLREFARTSKARAHRRLAFWFAGALAAALVCVLALRHQTAPAAQMEARLEIATLQMTTEDGFQAVPYAAQPADGEFIQVVHTEVAPDTLTRMGVFVPSDSGDRVPVDLVVGQDDAPLAVRVDLDSENVDSEQERDTP